jgi:hypothetical protein
MESMNNIAVQSGKRLQTLRRIVLPPSSVYLAALLEYTVPKLNGELVS